MSNKNTLDLQKEIDSLKAGVSARKVILNRLETTLTPDVSGIRNLLNQIYSLDIDSDIKQKMTDLCLNILKTKISDKQMQIELTSSNAALLSLIQSKHPALHHRELRISILIILDYDTKEIAHALSMSKRGLENIRYKMHKKMGLLKHQSIKTYLQELTINHFPHSPGME